MEPTRARYPASRFKRRGLFACVAFTMLACCAQAQYFKPFTTASKKLFAQATVPARGHSLAFDSATAVGSDSVYHHFGALNDTSTVMDPQCSGWGSPYCYRTELPLWSGTHFRTDNAGTYWFVTHNGDSLRFHLGAAPGEVSTFFEDAVQRFTFVKSGPDTMTVLGHTDSVFTYLVSHTDLAGQAIASELDQQPFIIGKNLGLIRFFRIDNFPHVLVPLDLIGNKGPDLGLHSITSASIHDYQPGDIVQFKTYSGYTLPPQPFTHYKNTVLSRRDTPDSVVYTVAWENFTPTGTTNSGTAVNRYSKQETHAEIPFERFMGAYASLTLSTTTDCDLPIWRLYRDMEPSLGWCGGEGNCWVAADTQGPPSTSSNSMVLGVGTASYLMDPPSSLLGPYYFDIKSIVYFKKNGVECGVEAHVGLEEIERIRTVTLGPNPANGEVLITSSQAMASVEVVDGHGRTMLQVQPKAAQVRLDLSGFSQGMCIARVLLQDGTRIHRRVIITAR